MGKYIVQPSQRTKQQGFTLIEVLIAMAIISIALTAVIKATIQNIRETHYLQEKTIANWVALQTLNEVQAHIIRLPQETEKLDKEISMLGETWTSQAYATATPNSHIEKIDVDVQNKLDKKNLIHLEGFLYVEN